MSMAGRVFYVGTAREVAHHARPLQPWLDVVVVEPDTVVDAARPGDVAVFYSEHFDRFRSACVALRQQNVATVYAVDGILEWRNAWENRADEIACPWTMRPCLSHVVATIGPRQTSILHSWGNANCVPIGLPRLDELGISFSKKHSDIGNTNDGLVAESRAAESPSAKFRVLVLTAKCPGFTEDQVETTYRSLVALREVVAQNPMIDGREVELVWRLTGDLDERLGVSNNSLDPLAVPESSGLPDVLARVDAVIATPSTAQLESMLMDRPVATLDFHNTPIYADTVFRISAPEHVRPTLEQLAKFSSSPAQQATQKFLLQENLLTDGQATKRMSELLRWMQAQSLSAHESGRSLELDVADVLTRLSYASNEPQQIFWELRNARVKCDADGTSLSLAQWQAYTEQLERENRRLSQLVSEAHEVFDNLHGHPVWGTLLKSHEWWIRLWQGDTGKLAKPNSWKEP
ncbi:MAG: hypothetical protein Q8M16_22095 [Pirellulaceae bacterium]|nr:hypothetical protein [Pirellulaceae bacterium]